MQEQLELITEGGYALNGFEGTHSAGRGELLHDWFPYLEGFSSGFVNKIVAGFFEKPELIIEPFNGVGTTPISLAALGINCAYSEANPFLIELMDLKKAALHLSARKAKNASKKLRELNETLSRKLVDQGNDESLKNSYENTFGKARYFPDENFELVLKIKTVENQISDKFVRRLFRMAVASSLLKSSLLKRAGDVRYRTEKELAEGTPNILEVLKSRFDLISQDLDRMEGGISAEQTLLTNDARAWSDFSLKADGVITSPPYLNGTNYIRNTKLELWYLGYLETKNDLRSLRTAVITSAINDVDKDSGRDVCSEAVPIVEELESNNYDHRIPRMVADYFNHMKIVMKGLARNVKTGSPICIDIGDSVYGGVHVPTHDILIDIGNNLKIPLDDQIILRKRFSNRGAPLSQRLLVFRKA